MLVQQRRPSHDSNVKGLTHDDFTQAINANHPRYQGNPNPEAYLHLNRNLFPPPARQPDVTSVWLDGEPPAIIHLPVTAKTTEAAIELALRLTASLAHVPELHGHDVRVSTGDDTWLRVYCNRTLADGSPCFRRWQHEGACQPDA